VSVSWRTLLFYQEVGLEKVLSPQDIAIAERPIETWRRFLLDQRPHPATFEQHVIHVDAAMCVSGDPVSPFLNRYFLRVVQTDVLASSTMCFTYSKLARLLIIGFLRVSDAPRWRQTKLHPRAGLLGAQDCEIPEPLFRYWNEKADQVARKFATMSPRQVQRLDQMFAATGKDKLASSEVFRAMRADVTLAGRDAFRVTGRSCYIDPRDRRRR
jgi:hypothetical protein